MSLRVGPMAGKRQVAVIDGTPKKRLFLSIISDYDLRIGLCELIDNALDLWISNGRQPSSIDIRITLDATRQLISVSDDAGGIEEAQLEFLIAPGASRNEPEQELIGIFGVGGKRAGVALGEHVEIRTRAKGGKSFQLDITNEWLASEDWDLEAYEIADLPVGTTTVDISKLRQSFDDEEVDRIRQHLAETYSWFIQAGCNLFLNKKPVKPKEFDAWAYPPEFPPSTVSFPIEPTEDRVVQATITAGLIRDRDPEAENYGVYFFCNNRLIVKELRTRDVGYFVTSEAGVPHPDASLCRVIVELHGPADSMPWNSSKSGINFSHPTFLHLRSHLIGMVSYYSSLSRRLKRDWDAQVFPYDEGEMRVVDAAEALTRRRIVLPKLPRTRRLPRIEEIRALNKAALKNMPWTIGLIEAIGLVEVISKQKLDTKNRAALILLDSNFEISLKEFIVNRSTCFRPNTTQTRKLPISSRQDTTSSLKYRSTSLFRAGC